MKPKQFNCRKNLAVKNFIAILLLSAGTTTRFSSGESHEDLARVAWFGQNGGNKTQPVGKKEPNAWGIYDMHGNVSEWCLDSPVREDLIRGLREMKDERVVRIVREFADELEEMSEEEWLSEYAPARIVRGGDFFNYAGYCEVSHIKTSFPDNWGSNLGFRLALVPAEE